MQAREVDVGGTTLLVREWGPPGARAAVFWHGLGDHTGLSIGEIAPALVDELGLRIVGVDAPGFGGSPPLPEPEGYLLPSLAALARQLIGALDLERPVWVGESWGGQVGVHLGALQPQSLAGLVLLDGGYRDIAEFADMSLDEIRAHWRAQPGFRLPSWEAAFAEPREYAGRWSPALEQAVLAAYRDEGEEVVSTMGPETLATAMWAARQVPPSEALAALGTGGMPVLLLAATEPPDPARDAALERFARLVPQATVVSLAGARHVVLLDAPQEIATAVVVWLRSL